MYKSYKFRLYPTNEQREKINKFFGCSRFVYNYYLSNMKENGVRNRYENIKDYVHKLQHEYTFLQETDSCIIRKTLFHVNDTMRMYKKGKIKMANFDHRNTQKYILLLYYT